LYSQARELIRCIHEYLILYMQIPKQFTFTGNQRPTMLHLAPLYVPCFLASSPLLPPYFASFQATGHVIDASFSRHFYSETHYRRNKTTCGLSSHYGSFPVDRTFLLISFYQLAISLHLNIKKETVFHISYAFFTPTLNNAKRKYNHE
jgi:hypothetical protein